MFSANYRFLYRFCTVHSYIPLLNSPYPEPICLALFLFLYIINNEPNGITIINTVDKSLLKRGLTQHSTHTKLRTLTKKLIKKLKGNK